MTETSPLLALPYLQPAQAQKHVTHNEALRLLDLLVQLAVERRDRPAPPLQPAEGERYIVPADPLGDWAGQAGAVTVFDQGAWRFLAPRPGWRAHVLAEGTTVAFDGTAWRSGTQALQNLPSLGIGTTADAGNPLSVAGPATLLMHGGGGDHLLKLNKAAPGDTGSLLFQTGFSGRAEMGLAGSDAFSVKVSADGQAWTEALRIDPASGRVSAPAGGLREMLTQPRTYHVHPTDGNDANDGLAPGAGRAFRTPGRAIAAAQALDAGGHAVTVLLAPGDHDLAAPLAIDRPLLGAPALSIEGDVAAPASVTLRAPGTVIDLQGAGLRLAGLRLVSTGAEGLLVDARDGARLRLADVEFGSAGTGHLGLRDAALLIEGDCTISGGAPFHLQLAEASRARSGPHTVTLTGTPAFATAFVTASENSVGHLTGLSFVGTATGRRYLLLRGAVLHTAGGTAYFPGNLAGSITSGGLYS